jgi:ABC-type nitrate/sulfonate/bicarbonate transport system substrate-binding protein
MRINFARACRVAARLAVALLIPAFWAAPVEAERLDVEKPNLKLGFIKLTDMAPLAIAYEKGFFEDEGLFVKLEPQANWEVLLDRLINGELDGAHMLAGQPLRGSTTSRIRVSNLRIMTRTWSSRLPRKRPSSQALTEQKPEWFANRSF